MQLVQTKLSVVAVALVVEVDITDIDGLRAYKINIKLNAKLLY